MKYYLNLWFLKDLKDSIESKLNESLQNKYIDLLNDNIIRFEFLNIRDGLEEYGILWSTEYKIF